MATINGGTGNDSLTGLAESDSITGNAGNDTLTGLGGNDSIFGGDGSDSLFGGIGNDLLEGGAGNDDFDGGDGIDTLSYQGSNAAVFVSLSIGTTEGGHAAGDTFTGIENLMGSAFNDTLIGDNTGNVIWGLAGDDSIDGRLGDDTLHGGTGNDLYVVGDAGDIVVEALNSGNDTINAWIDFTLSDNVEVLRLFGTNNINGTGNGLANILHGNEDDVAFGGDNLLQGLAGNDTLYGYNGFDTLDGGTGNDVMHGGTGDDLFIVDSAGDQVIELANGGTDTVASSINYILYDPVTSNHIENVTLTGTANLTATGNSLRNVLIGNTGNNILSGGGGNDSLRGNEGNDTLDGGTGSDTLIGGTGDDVYYVDHSQDTVSEAGNGGIDTVWTSVSGYALSDDVENLNLGLGVAAGSGNSLGNILTGNASNNTLDGKTGNDTLFGGAGNDTLIGGSGADSMQGGAGDDVYRVDNIGDIAEETLAGSGGIDRVEITAHHVMGTGIENLLVLGSGDVGGTGNTLNNIMTGFKGDNLLNGMDGNDTLYGDDGEDTLIGGEGVDVFYGGEGNDLFVLDSATEVIFSALNDGIDTVQIAASYTLSEHLENLILDGTGHFSGTGNAAANRMTGNDGHNGLFAGSANDSLFGGAGNDTLDGGTGADSMVGGTGNDLYLVDHANDKVSESSASGGIDTVQSVISYALGSNLEHLTLTGTANVNATGNSLANTLTGNAGNNLLFGDGGNDVLNGNGGNDTLDGGSCNDTMSGGTGDDTYVLSGSGDVIIELAGQGTDTVISAASLILAETFENLTLSGTAGLTGTGNAAANVLTGNSGANLLTGLAGNDTLDGGAGADTLDGGTGNDVMTGGTGNDLFIVDAAGDVVVEAAGGGTDTVQTVFTTTLAATLENLVLTGTANLNGTGNAAANILTGNSGHNLLTGLDGNDTLSGGSGDDTLDGGTGNDSMSGGTGNDIYYVDNIRDVIVESTSGGTDLVYTSASFTMATGLENLIMQGSANLNATGNSSANSMTGNAGHNSLSGGSGADTLNGGAGNDTLDGGTGNDSMVGGSGDDTYHVNASGDQIVEGAGAGTDTVLAATNWTLGSHVEHLTMVSTGSYRGVGNSLDNIMTGNRGKNTLQGEAGNDTLNGGAGNDVLTGGSGADHFVFSGATPGNDTITDFNAVDGGVAEGDRLVFDDLLVGTFVYRGSAAFSGGSNNSEARFDSTSGQLQIDADGNGTAEFSLTLTGLTQATQLTASDFIWT